MSEKKIGENDTEDYRRLGRYESGKTRPLKETFQSVNQVEGITTNGNRLKEIEEFKDIWLKIYQSQEEREIVKKNISQEEK